MAGEGWDGEKICILFRSPSSVLLFPNSKKSKKSCCCCYPCYPGLPTPLLCPCPSNGMAHGTRAIGSANPLVGRDGLHAGLAPVRTQTKYPPATLGPTNDLRSDSDRSQRIARKSGPNLDLSWEMSDAFSHWAIVSFPSALRLPSAVEHKFTNVSTKVESHPSGPFIAIAHLEP